MLAYIDMNGVQGGGSYLYGFMNTLFPRFIFDEYLFGEPLVLRIQNELGWVGFDFGFMAEAIYSGGLFAVCIVHFMFGVCLAVILRGVKRGRILFLALLIGIIFGMVNSLRSDFMNLLKSFLYSSFMLYFIFKIAIFKYKKNSSKRSWADSDD
jgi:hypothetical protein